MVSSDASPGTAAGTPDPAARVAVYALLHDQDLATPMKVFATDEAGNTASADIDSRVFPKVFRKSRIEVPDPFFQRVVPAILENSADFAREDVCRAPRRETDDDTDRLGRIGLRERDVDERAEDRENSSR